MTRFRRWLGHHVMALGHWIFFGRRRWPPPEHSEQLGCEFEAVWDANVDKLHES